MNEGLLIPKTLDYAVCQQQYHKDDSSKIKNKSLEMINGTFYSYYPTRSIESNFAKLSKFTFEV